MTHLDLLNVALSWCFDQPGWPRILGDTQYLVHGVGVTLALADGRRVAPDVAATSSAHNTSLLVEVKSGKNVDADQLGRMEALTAADLRDINHHPVRDLVTHVVQILYLCSADHFSDVVAAVAGRRVTVVGLDGTQYQIGGAQLVDADLHRALTTATILAGAEPLAIVPFDQDSKLSRVAADVMPHVVEALVRGVGTLTADGVLQRTHHIVYEVMRPTGTRTELNGIRDQIAAALREATENEFKDWVGRAPGDQAWRLKKSLSDDPAAKTRELQSLLKATENLTERLRVREDEPQMELFRSNPEQS